MNYLIYRCDCGRVLYSKETTKTKTKQNQNIKQKKPQQKRTKKNNKILFKRNNKIKKMYMWKNIKC